MGRRLKDRHISRVRYPIWGHGGGYRVCCALNLHGYVIGPPQSKAGQMIIDLDRLKIPVSQNSVMDHTEMLQSNKTGLGLTWPPTIT